MLRLRWLSSLQNQLQDQFQDSKHHHLQDLLSALFVVLLFCRLEKLEGNTLSLVAGQDQGLGVLGGLSVQGRGMLENDGLRLLSFAEFPPLVLRWAQPLLVDQPC